MSVTSSSCKNEHCNPIYCNVNNFLILSFLPVADYEHVLNKPAGLSIFLCKYINFFSKTYDVSTIVEAELSSCVINTQ